MASASTPSANEPAKDLILVHTVQLIPIIYISQEEWSKWCSDRSVSSEKTCLKKLMIRIIIINKSQETMVLEVARKLLPL